MNDFRWELPQVIDGLRKDIVQQQITRFLRPHCRMWGNGNDNFVELADGIMALLPTPEQLLFLRLCMGSYLLEPTKAPESVHSWIQRQMPVSDAVGIDVTLDELLTWRWGRAAFPVLDEFEEGRNDTIYYALVANAPNGSYPPMPEWSSQVMNSDAQDAVKIAIELAQQKLASPTLFFWPFINPKKPTHDRSLGLPTYLSFLSLLMGKPIPLVIATGNIDRQGTLHRVQGVTNKSGKAFDKGYKRFIYPEDGSCLERQREFTPIGVCTLQEAEDAWEGTTQRTRLNNLLSPLPYHKNLEIIPEDYSGREWLTNKIDKWVDDPEGDKIFMLVADAGFGKSAFAAWLCKNRHYVAAHHFCRFDSPASRDIRMFTESIACQIADRVPDYMNKLPEHRLSRILAGATETLFEELLKNRLSEVSLQIQKPIVILVDSLDESITANSRVGITQLLFWHAKEFPPWIRFLITTRADTELITRFDRCTCFHIEADSYEVRDDIVRYSREKLPGSSPEFLLKLAEKTAGNFLYISSVVRDIICGRLSPENIDNLPENIVCNYRNQFDRSFSHRIDTYRSVIRPVLQILVAVFEPVSLEFIANVLSLTDGQLRDRLSDLGTLFVTEDGGGRKILRAHHQTIIEWLRNPQISGNYFIDRKEGDLLLTNFASKYSPDYKSVPTMPSYLLCWLPQHLQRLDKKEELIRLLRNFDFMMLRSREGHEKQLLSDYVNILYNELSEEALFFSKYSRLLSYCPSENWPAHKMLLQLAAQYAGNSSVTIGADRFLSEEKCNWPWLRREDRPFCIIPNAERIMLLGEGCFLAKMPDKKTYLWNPDSSEEKCVFPPDETEDATHKAKESGIHTLSRGTYIIWQDYASRCILTLYSRTGKKIKTAEFDLNSHDYLRVYNNIDSKIILDAGNEFWLLDYNLKVREYFSVPAELLGIPDFSFVISGLVKLNKNLCVSINGTGWVFKWEKDIDGVWQLVGYENIVTNDLDYLAYMKVSGEFYGSLIRFKSSFVEFENIYMLKWADHLDIIKKYNIDDYEIFDIINNKSYLHLKEANVEYIYKLYNVELCHLILLDDQLNVIADISHLFGDHYDYCDLTLTTDDDSCLTNHFGCKKSICYTSYNDIFAYCAIYHTDYAKLSEIRYYIKTMGNVSDVSIHKSGLVSTAENEIKANIYIGNKRVSVDEYENFINDNASIIEAECNQMPPTKSSPSKRRTLYSPEERKLYNEVEWSW